MTLAALLKPQRNKIACHSFFMLVNFVIAIQLEERVSVTVTAVWKSGSDMTFNNQGTS